MASEAFSPLGGGGGSGGEEEEGDDAPVASPPARRLKPFKPFATREVKGLAAKVGSPEARHDPGEETAR